MQDPLPNEHHKDHVNALEELPDEHNPEGHSNTESNQGYCVLSIGENVDINGGNFKLLSINKKEIMLTCPDNVKDLKIKPYQKIQIKNGNFIVKSFGRRSLIALSVPGNHVLDQKHIDDAHKVEIERLREKQDIKYNVSEADDKVQQLDEISPAAELTLDKV